MVAECLEVLQKPSDERMKSRGALLESETGQFQFADGIELDGEVVYTDSSFFFGVDVVKRLLKLKTDLGTISCEIDAYGDFLQALGPCATDDYIFNTSNISQMTSDLTQVRKQVFSAMRGCEIHLLLLHASKFIHVGTTKELIHHFCQDSEFQNQMALQKDVFNCWLAGGVSDVEKHSAEKTDDSAAAKSDDIRNHVNVEGEKGQGCVMHSVLRRSSSVAASSVVEYCHFDVPVTVEENCIISNCQWLGSERSATESLVLPSDTFLHTVSVLHQGASYYVTVFFNISDNLKTSVEATSLTKLPFLNTTVASALKQWQLPQKVVLSGMETPEAKVSLWTLKLYPGVKTMTKSLERALDMVGCLRGDCALSRSLTQDNLVFFSLSDALAQKDVSTMLTFRRRLFDQIQSSQS